MILSSLLFFTLVTNAAEVSEPPCITATCLKASLSEYKAAKPGAPVEILEVRLKHASEQYEIFLLRQLRGELESALTQAWKQGDLKLAEFLSEVLVRSGDYDPVIRAFDKSKAEKNVYLTYWKCAALRGSGKIDSAVSCLEPHVEDIWFFFDYIDTQTIKQFDTAKSKFLARVRSQPALLKNPWIYFLNQRFSSPSVRDLKWMRSANLRDPGLHFAILGYFADDLKDKDVKGNVLNRQILELDKQYPGFHLNRGLAEPKVRKTIIEQLGPHGFYSRALIEFEKATLN